MALRISKIMLLSAVGFFFFLVFLNNGVLDYHGNYEFVRHVVSMDTTGADHPHLWRGFRPADPAVTDHWVYHAFYWGLMACEITAGILCTVAAVRLWRVRKRSGAVFNAAKCAGIYGLTVSLLQWFTLSLTVGGEWFLMFLSKDWNAQESAFRMFACLGIILIFLALKDDDLPVEESKR